MTDRIQVLQNGVVVFDSAPEAAKAESVQPTVTDEPGGDYSTELVPPGGHGHKFRPGRTSFTFPDVQPGQRLEVAFVSNNGDLTATITAPDGGVVADWTIPGIDTKWTPTLIQAGTYTLYLHAPGYGEINHQRHP